MAECVRIYGQRNSTTMLHKGIRNAQVRLCLIQCTVAHNSPTRASSPTQQHGGRTLANCWLSPKVETPRAPETHSKGWSFAQEAVPRKWLRCSRLTNRHPWHRLWLKSLDGCSLRAIRERHHQRTNPAVERKESTGYTHGHV